MACGFVPETFWRLTPREYLLRIEGYQAGENRRREFQKSLGWFIAAGPRLRKFPSHDQFVSPQGSTRSGPQTWEQMLSVAREWHARLAKEGQT